MVERPERGSHDERLAAASDEIVEGAEGGVEHDAFAEADDDVSPTSPEVATLNPRPDVNEAHAGLL